MPRTLEKYTWPQDVLVNPETDGQNIDPINAKRGRESFTYVTDSIAVSTVFNHTQAFVVEPSCMFWMNNFSAVLYGVNEPRTFNTPGFITLTDNATGFRVLTSVSLGALGYVSPALGSRVPPERALYGSSRSTIPRPYCIRQGNSFTVNLFSTVGSALYNGYRLQVTIEGWKDYSYA